VVIYHPLSASCIYYDPCHPPVQFTWLTVFLCNLCPSFLWSTSFPDPSTSYSIHFFTQSLTSFCSTCLYHRKLFCCSTKFMSSNHNLSTLYLELYLLATHLSDHSHLWPLKCHLIFLSYEPGFTSMQHAVSHTTAVESPCLTINDTSLLVSNGTKYLNLLHPI